MDETQRRKVTAKEFIQNNKKIGFVVIAIFVSLFVIYFFAVYFYSKSSAVDNLVDVAENSPQSVIENLLPTFFENDKQTEVDNDPLLGIFSNGSSNLPGSVTDGEDVDTTSLTLIESKPVSNYISFLKPKSIKNYISDKPKICETKLEVVLKKDTKNNAVVSMQNMLRSIDGYEDTPDSGVLDNNTSEKLSVFQQKYSNFIYKKKSDKTPTKVLDKETTHILNLLCGFDTETSDDFVEIQTIRYVTKEDRQIYDYDLETKTRTKFETKVATGTEETVFSPKGDFVVFRSEKDGAIVSEFMDVRTKNTVKLENNITTLDFNNKNMLIYGVPGSSGMTIKLYDQSKNSLRTIAQIPLNEWTIFFSNQSDVGIYSKPSAQADGIFMLLNSSTKSIKQLAGPMKGMSVIPTSQEDYSIVSSGSFGSIKSFLLNNTTRTIGSLEINTFAEKCSKTIFSNAIFCAVPKAINSNHSYPDDWYKGKSNFSDVIMYKSTTGTTSKIISNLEGKDLSVVNMQINKNGIFFIDERALGLYQLLP